MSLVGDVHQRLGPIPYRSPRQRCGWDLPGSAQLAVWVIPNVEVFPLDEPVPGGSASPPDVMAFAARDYGARVGFWRVLDALEEVDVTATAAVNGGAIGAYPEVAAGMAESGWETMGHCWTNNRRLSEMDDGDEKDTVSRVTEVLTDAMGVAPRGWLGAGLQERWSTPDALAAAGYDYVADWVSDDRPNRLEGSGLTSVPYSTEVNDKPAFDTWRMTPDEFADLALRQFETLWREGADEPRVLGIALHPYLIGVPHRIDALRRMLGVMREREGVWWTTGSAIADRYRANS